MTVDKIDLYGFCRHERGSAQGGHMSVFAQHTPDAVSLNRTRPAVLILPGGGYSHTSLRESESVAVRFVAAGYAVFVLHYSCAPDRFPVALRESAMAMAYIRQNASKYGINHHMVAALGFSAGGHLCGCLGTMYDCQEVSDLGNPEDLRPDALALCYPVAISWGKTHKGSFDNLCGENHNLRENLSLDKLVRSDMPPVFLWHTRSDESVPCRNSLILAVELEKAGVDFAMHIYRKGPHGLSTADVMAYPAYGLPEISRDVTGWVDGCINFFEEIGLKITDNEVRV